MKINGNLKLVFKADPAEKCAVEIPRASGPTLLSEILSEGVIFGDSGELLARLPRQSVDLFFTSPPYADARSYSRIH